MPYFHSQVTRHVNVQENMTKMQRNQIMKTDPKQTQMLELAKTQKELTIEQYEGQE